MSKRLQQHRAVENLSLLVDPCQRNQQQPTADSITDKLARAMHTDATAARQPADRFCTAINPSRNRLKRPAAMY